MLDAREDVVQGNAGILPARDNSAPIPSSGSGSVRPGSRPPIYRADLRERHLPFGRDSRPFWVAAPTGHIR